MSRLARAVASGVVVLAVGACGVIPSPPPPLEADFIPDAVAPTFDAAAITSDGFSIEQHLAVRIRVQTCDGWQTGSGWILSDHEVVTNRHVIEDGFSIEVTTYDGVDYAVKSSKIAELPDLALLTLDSVFDESAEYEVSSMEFLDPVTIVGYPSGEQLVVEEGHYLSADPDTVWDSGELVWSLRGHVKHGSSGSPVYNDEGKVVAVIYAGDEFTTALAWPVIWLDQLIKDPSQWKANKTTCKYR